MTRVYDSNSIISLQGLEKVTNNPQIFIGDVTTPNSLFQMIKEIVDNSIDEAPYGVDFFIKIFLFHNKELDRYQCLVMDNGFGIGRFKLKAVFTEEGTSGKYKKLGTKRAYRRSAGTFGRGSKAVAGLSSVFCALTQHKTDGSGLLLIKDAQIEKTELFEDSYSNGVFVFSEPSPTYFQTIKSFMTGDGLSLTLDYIETMYVNNPNINFEFKKIEGLIDPSLFDKSFNYIWDTFNDIAGGEVLFKSSPEFDVVAHVVNKLGIKGNILLNETLEYDKDDLGFKINIIVDDNFGDLNNSKFMSYVNNNPIKSIESHQVIALINVLREKLSKHAENIKIQKFVKYNYKLPMYFNIYVLWDLATFGDLVKSVFRDTKFSGLYYATLVEMLSDSKYTTVFSTLYELFKENIQEQYDKYINKSTPSVGGTKNIGSKLDKFDRYASCKIKDPEVAELYLVEGKSAFSTLKLTRNRDFQALFACQGKPVNSFKKDTDVFKDNTVLRDLTAVLGIKPGDPIEKINFKNIYIAADADAHGLHITDMIIGALYCINPEILDRGYVNMIVSPSYRLIYKNRSMFIKDFNALFKFNVTSTFQFLFDFKLNILNEACNGYDLVDITDSRDILNYCSILYKVGAVIDSTSKRLSVDPILLERLSKLYHHLKHINTDKLKEFLGYDRVEYNSETDTILFVKEEIEIFILVKVILKEIEDNILPVYDKYYRALWEPFISMRDKTDVELPTDVVGIYYILESSIKDIHVHKFKGLSSMSPDLLEPTCTSPTTRSFIKLTSLGDIGMIEAMLGKDATERKKL